VSAANQDTAEKIQKATHTSTKISMWHTWIDVTLDELKAFPGVLINMVLNMKTQLLDYFSEEWLDRMPFFKENFSSEVFKITLGTASCSSCGNAEDVHP